MRINYQSVIFQLVFLIAFTNCRPPSGSSDEEHQRLRDLRELKDIITREVQKVRDYQARHKATHDEALRFIVRDAPEGDEKRTSKRRIHEIIRQDPKYFLSKIDNITTNEELNERCAHFRRNDEKYRRLLDVHEFTDTMIEEVQKVRNYQARYNVTPDEAVRSVIRESSYGDEKEEKRRRIQELIREDPEYFLSNTHNFTTGNEWNELYAHFYKRNEKNRRLWDLQELKEIMGRDERKARDYQTRHNVTFDVARKIVRNLPRELADRVAAIRALEIMNQDPQYFLSNVFQFSTEDALNEGCANISQMYKLQTPGGIVQYYFQWMMEYVKSLFTKRGSCEKPEKS